jgi:hypothetical protein
MIYGDGNRREYRRAGMFHAGEKNQAQEINTRKLLQVFRPGPLVRSKWKRKGKVRGQFRLLGSIIAKNQVFFWVMRLW